MSMEDLKSEIYRLAEEEAKRIVDNAKEERKRILSQAEEKTKQVIDKKVQETNRKLVEKERIELALARIEARKKVLNIKFKYLDDVFKETENRLREVSDRKPSSYGDILVNYIVEAVNNLEGKKLLVQVNKRDQQIIDDVIDMAKKSLKKSGKNVELKTAPLPIDTTGGVIVYTEDMKQYYVNTFESRLAKIKSENQGKVIEILLRSE